MEKINHKYINPCKCGRPSDDEMPCCAFDNETGTECLKKKEEHILTQNKE